MMRYFVLSAIDALAFVGMQFRKLGMVSEVNPAVDALLRLFIPFKDDAGTGIA